MFGLSFQVPLPRTGFQCSGTVTCSGGALTASYSVPACLRTVGALWREREVSGQVVVTTAGVAATTAVDAGLALRFDMPRV